jgi:hypothetical protein
MNQQEGAKGRSDFAVGTSVLFGHEIVSVGFRVNVSELSSRLTAIRGVLSQRYVEWVGIWVTCGATLKLRTGISRLRS